MVDLETVPCCPVCGSDKVYYEFSHPALGYDFDINVMYCVDCQCSYHNPRMTAQSMKEYYASGAYAAAHKKNNDGEKHRAISRTELLRASSIPAPKRCLDVGCAQGYLLEELERVFGAETVGFDFYVDERAIREIITDKDKIMGKFDFISCLHVLEHMHDPIKELEWMSGLLEHDGSLFLEVPLSRQVLVPHPIIFSQSSLDYLMQQIGIESYTVCIPADREIGLVIGVK